MALQLGPQGLLQAVYAAIQPLALVVDAAVQPGHVAVVDQDAGHHREGGKADGQKGGDQLRSVHLRCSL